MYMGHNYLADLAAQINENRDARAVNEAEGVTLDIECGHLLNKGREQFPSNEQFGRWVSGKLPPTEKHERSAMMWAAANPDDFAAVRAAHPNVRTVRGWHAKWKAAQVGPGDASASKRKGENIDVMREIAEELTADGPVDKQTLKAAFVERTGDTKHTEQTIGSLAARGELNVVGGLHQMAVHAPIPAAAPKSVKEYKATIDRRWEKERAKLERELENERGMNKMLRMSSGRGLRLTRSEDRVLKMFFGREDVPHDVRCVWNDKLKNAYTVVEG